MVPKSPVEVGKYPIIYRVLAPSQLEVGDIVDGSDIR